MHDALCAMHLFCMDKHVSFRKKNTHFIFRGVRRTKICLTPLFILLYTCQNGWKNMLNRKMVSTRHTLDITFLWISNFFAIDYLWYIMLRNLNHVGHSYRETKRNETYTCEIVKWNWLESIHEAKYNDFIDSLIFYFISIYAFRFKNFYHPVRCAHTTKSIRNDFKSIVS